MSVSRQRVIDEALSWEGTPYRHQAMVKGHGVDCAMLLVGVFSAVGAIPKIDPRPYPRDWHFHRSQERFVGWITLHGEAVDAPLPGDVALFKFGRCISHGAIVLEWPNIIHAYYMEGVVRADASKGVLSKRSAGWYRVMGVE